MVPAKCQDSTSRKVENLDNLPGQLMEPIDERNIFRNPARWPSKSYKETRKKQIGVTRKGSKWCGPCTVHGLEKWTDSATADHVITVGLSLPVNSWSLEIPNATLMMGPRDSWASLP